MFKNRILRDMIGTWLLLTGCLVSGLVLNEFRTKPLSLVYASPQTRLDHAVNQINPAIRSSLAPDGDVSTNEMQQISTDHAALILDARPEVFYRLGHIPSALSLPRDDFEKRFPVLQAALQAHRDNPLVVYCSSNECHDSQMVAEALQKLGYAHVRLFRGGWSDWESANLPEEKE